MLIHTHAHTHTNTDSCSYKLDKGSFKVSEVFQQLDSVKTELGILDWGIKMTTLEDGELTYYQRYTDYIHVAIFY